jgi:hypothetical protein
MRLSASTWHCVFFPVHIHVRIAKDVLWFVDRINLFPVLWQSSVNSWYGKFPLLIILMMDVFSPAMFSFPVHPAARSMWHGLNFPVRLHGSLGDVMKMKNIFKKTLLLACGVFVLSTAAAVEVAGVKIDDTAKVANVELKLNGAGIRRKAFFNVYIGVLYLKEKNQTTADVIAATGPKRISLVMLRDVSSEAFGQSFMDGLNHNSTKAEKTKIVGQMLKFGEMFANIPELKKGDVVTVDWIPDAGSQTQVNGKKTADILPDVAFYNALLKIWLGDKPAYAPLKRDMLGAKEHERDVH